MQAASGVPLEQRNGPILFESPHNVAGHRPGHRKTTAPSTQEGGVDHNQIPECQRQREKPPTMQRRTAIHSVAGFSSKMIEAGRQ